MAFDAIGTTELDTAIPKLWLNQVLLAFREGSVLSNLVTVDSGLGANDYSGKGKTVAIQTITSDIEVQDKNEYEEYTSDTAETDELTLTLDQQPYIQWKRTELGDLFSLPVGQAIIADSMPKLITRVENDLFAEYANAGAYVGVAGTPITPDTVTAARRKFLEANVPQGMWSLVIGPSDDEALINTLTPVDYSGSDMALRAGAIGRLRGFDVYSTNRVPTVSSVNYNLALAPGAIRMVCRPLPPPAAELGGASVRSEILFDPQSGLSFRWMAFYDPDEGTYVSRIEMLYGVKTLRPEALVQVRS